jgi:hypothetical protein
LTTKQLWPSADWRLLFERLPPCTHVKTLLSLMELQNHSFVISRSNGACKNWAEEFFSRMRRAEQGHYHHIAGPSTGFATRKRRRGAKTIAGLAMEQVHMVSGWR